MDKQQILQTTYASKVSNWEKVFRQNPSIIESAYESMDTFAKQKAIEFAEWVNNNRWYLFQNGKWRQSFEHGTIISDKDYELNHVKTSEQLYELFFKSQN